MTRIHGRYYDLTNFKHPGGPIPIGLVDGRDGTELFESHHLFTSRDMQGILSAYEVEDHLEIACSGVYDWQATKSDPFTLELHEAARKVLGKDIKATRSRQLLILVMLLVALTQVYGFARGDWFSILTMPLAVWVFAVNVFHDASHFALSRSSVVNDLGTEIGFMFSTPYVWYH